MNVDVSFFEQVMSSAVNGKAGPNCSKGEGVRPGKGEGGQESVFALRFQEVMKELFPEAVSEELFGDDVSGKNLVDPDSLLAFLSGEDGEFKISLKDAAFLKELLSANDFSSFFAGDAFKELLPGLKELFPDMAGILAALEAEGLGLKEAVDFMADELSNLYPFYLSPEEAAKALADIRNGAEGFVFNEEAVKDFLASDALKERGEMLLTEEEAAKLAALTAALKGEAAQKLADDGLTFKEMLSADAKKLKDFLELLEKLAEKGETAKELKAAKELVRDALANEEKKDDLHNIRAGFLKEVLYNVKAAEGRPAGGTQSAGDATLLELEESLGKKVSAVFASDGSSMNSSGEGSKEQNLANSFMAFDSEKEAMLNLSRFSVSEIVDGKVYANAKGEFSSPQQVRAAVLDQITGRLNFFRETGSLPAEMRMTLNPPSLGAVVIRVFMKQGKMSAEILTELSEVKDILDKSITDLRQRLQNVNLVLERIDVYTADKDASGNNLFNRENKFAELAAAVAGKIGASAGSEGEPLDSEVALWGIDGVHSLDIRA